MGIHKILVNIYIAVSIQIVVMIFILLKQKVFDFVKLFNNNKTHKNWQSMNNNETKEFIKRTINSIHQSSTP